MSQEKFESFASLHVKGAPVVLCNIWSAGSAKAVEASGAAAIGTSSWACAAAAGYEDGEIMPLNSLLETVRAIARAVELPITVDFEGGYARDLEGLHKNVSALLATGAIGCNFEDRRIHDVGVYDIDTQCQRIAALTTAAPERPLFINARTDVFLLSDPGRHAMLVDEAAARATAYKRAGAHCFFAPGLTDLTLIADLCLRAPLPVNIMVMSPEAEIAPLANAGVARISFGPTPYLVVMRALREIVEKTRRG